MNKNIYTFIITISLAPVLFAGEKTTQTLESTAAILTQHMASKAPAKLKNPIDELIFTADSTSTFAFIESTIRNNPTLKKITVEFNSEPSHKAYTLIQNIQNLHKNLRIDTTIRSENFR